MDTKLYIIEIPESKFLRAIYATSPTAAISKCLRKAFGLNIKSIRIKGIEFDDPKKATRFIIKNKMVDEIVKEKTL